VELLGFLILCIFAFRHPFSQATYAWVSLIGNGTISILELVVIYTLADLLIFSRFSSLSWLRFVFGGSLAVLVLIAGAIAGTLADISTRTATNIFHVIDFGAGLVKAGILFTLFFMSRTLQISWRNWLTGIALGFGVSACIQLAGAALRDYFGHASLIPVDIVEMVGFHACVTIWFVYVLLPEHTDPHGRGLGKAEIASWSEELERIVQH